MHQINVVTLGTGFIDGTVHDTVATGTPGGHFDAIFFFKGVNQWFEVFLGNGGIQRQTTFGFGRCG